MIRSIEIPFPDDWHVHLRDDAMLEAVVGYTARRFRYAMVMPNVTPPITSTATAMTYRERILKHAPPEKLAFAPDCGLSQTARWAAKLKLKHLTDGVRLVRRELGF